MKDNLDWHRYAVVHWLTILPSEDGLPQPCSRTRAFGELREAVMFISHLDSRYQREAKIDCGGITYQLLDIERLIALSDFSHLQPLSNA